MRIPKSEDSHFTIKKIMGPHHNHFFLHFFLSFLFPLQLSFVLLPSLTDWLWQFRVGSGLRGILGCSQSQWWFGLQQFRSLARLMTAMQSWTSWICWWWFWAGGEADGTDVEVDFMNFFMVVFSGQQGW